MIPEKIIYTDGHDVTVTESEFKVKNHNYNLNGIIKHWLQVIRPYRLPWLVLLGIGAAILIAGLLHLFPITLNFYVGDKYIVFNNLMIWVGAVLGIISIIVLIVSRDRYAVRIATAEGEKDAVVSNKKEYIAQIDGALNKAFSNFSKTR
jgi:uncharacterized membrane protein